MYHSTENSSGNKKNAQRESDWEGWDMGAAGGSAERLSETLRLAGHQDPSTAMRSFLGYLEQQGIYTQTKTDMPLREDVGKNSLEHLAISRQERTEEILMTCRGEIRLAAPKGHKWHFQSQQPSPIKRGNKRLRRTSEQASLVLWVLRPAGYTYLGTCSLDRVLQHLHHSAPVWATQFQNKVTSLSSIFPILLQHCFHSQVRGNTAQHSWQGA